VIARCLARDPKARFASAALLRDTLGAMLREVGITSATEKLALFFADPEGASARISAEVVNQRLENARARISQGNTAGAMAALGQVLALEPKHSEALVLLDSLKRRARHRKRLSSAALGLVALGFAGTGAYAAFTHRAHTPAPALVNPKPSNPHATALPNASVPVPAAITPAKPLVERPKLAVLEPERRVPIRRDLVSKPDGKVLIKVFPYADIFIDGTRVAAGANSFPATLSAGSHALRFEHPGMAPKQMSLDIPAGAQARDVRVRLDPLPWHLIVKNHQNAGVEVDGKLVGTASMSLRRPFEQPMPLDPSGQPVYRTTVQVTLSQQGYKDWSETRTIEAGETLTVAQELAPQ
jgi:hypothetical protein